MPIRVALNHQTTYTYDRPIRLGPQIVRLRPAPHCRTPILSYSLKIEPGEYFINWQQDPQSNFLARLVFPRPMRRFSVTVDLVADMTVINPFDFFIEPEAESFPFQYDPWLGREIAPFLVCHDHGAAFNSFMLTVPRKHESTVNFIVELNRRVQAEIRYLIRMEPGVQTPDETLTSGSGSCRDSAWLMVQALRHLGIAARFVSGYLIQLRADQESLDGPAGPSEDFTDLHAWCEAYLPGAGWVGVDPTSGLLTGEGHIPLAATPDPLSAAPISGTLEGAKTEFGHQMAVTRIHEDPRVTLPYTEQQWADIEKLGREVDRLLESEDVRLTMGGEPTFVSIDDMDGPEWNTLAVGDDKRRIAGQLLRRLAARFARHPLLHFGQGKWYPAEHLPRWALSAYWRKDGLPLWNDPDLIADDRRDYGFTHTHAQRFLRRLAHRLGLDVNYVLAAYEDPIPLLDKEGSLPVNVDATDNKLDDPEERHRIRRVFERGLSKPSGYVLPIRRGQDEDGSWVWQSSPWKIRSRYLTLIPGDSPIGLRLPLDKLPWADKKDLPWDQPDDPSIPVGPLPAPPRYARHQASVRRASASTAQRINPQMLPPGPGDDRRWRAEIDDWEPSPPSGEDAAPINGDDEGIDLGESAHWIIRAAMAVEPREGRLHVFMPPTQRLNDFIALLNAVEATAAELQFPIIVEGYGPPKDHRINVIKVTPDPGVIEVNVHPASNWDELVSITTGLYEDARQSRLGTEKFMLDGRHTGTGGGNHLVLGGPSTLDSPLIRRPDLLQSLLTYWINHPSLSYLFSGLFIGPTSQAPRIDEARPESVYELEIAFDALRHEAGNGNVPPWLVDRVFRNLLTDLTGNTHRAEFCIDKLYSPDTPTGRLGLLEFRAFEMPPHARMSLTQQLLVRAMIARFWHAAYTARPVRWGMALHDRFMLPHYIWADFQDVITDMRERGFALDMDWFLPHHEFRFPVFGRVEYEGIGIELRQAIEPWLVLGEEPAGGGTVRYVDSSVERLQVKVTGLLDTRHLVTCNGRRLPLRSTGVAGEFVAGVRYRAWQPTSCLHPTLGVDTPLVFDLLDTWNHRSLGGCTYHVSHPAGRNYETFPVNAFEAEARRVARFQEYGHTPGTMTIPPEEPNTEFPHTLDLRRQPRR
ncbi:MAG: transglutaminase family protein [Phycisphaeraceae bacterium]|nr:transglutaminase family protein [Phycisphaeraceae bacterium]